MDEKKINKLLFYHRLIVALLAIFVLMIAVALLLVLPKTLAALNAAADTLEQVNETAASADRELERLDTVFDHLNVLMEDTQSSLSEATDKINQMDEESLNEAIVNLKNVVSPLAEFFGKFD